MPASLDPGDRKVIIAAGALLALTTIAGLLFRPAEAGPSPGYPSSYSTSSEGGKAAYLLLREAGSDVERWEQPPQDLPAQPQNVLLILTDPIIPPSAEEKARIRAFVRSGGRVLTTGWFAERFFPEVRLSPHPRIGLDEESLHALLPGPLSRGAPEIVLRPGSRWRTTQPEELSYYADAAGSTVVSCRMGKGRLTWWADAEPLTNYGLTRAGNLVLFLNSLGRPGRTRVLWDEYFHGQRRGFGSYMLATPAPWLIVQFGVLMVVVLAGYSRRSGPVRPLARSGERLSPLEFVETVGDLYARKRAAREALDIAYHRFRFLLLRLGVPTTASPEQVGRGLAERLGREASVFFKTCQRSERAVKGVAVNEAEALRLIQELHIYAERWRLAGRFRGD
jgi:hypothetical protein